MIWSIAWKNVWRNKLRSAVVILAITLGLIGGIFVAGMTNGMAEQRISHIISNEISHIQIHHPKFQENNNLKYRIENSDEILKTIRQFPEVKAACGRIIAVGMLKSPRTSLGIQIIGIEPEMERQVTQIYRCLLDSAGNYFEGKKRLSILISKKLTAKLKVQMRKRLSTTFQDANGELTQASFRVSGIFNTQNSLFDKMNVFVRKSDLRKITKLQPSESHEIAMLLHDVKNTEKVVSKLEKLYPQLEIESWSEIQPDLRLTTDFMTIMMYVFVIIILLALGFGIVNTILMVILERVKELGMLMAIGMNRLRIFKMIMLETVFLAVTGGMLGIFSSFLLIQYFSKVGIDLSMYAEGFEAIGYATMMYPDVPIDFYFGVSLLVVLTGILAAIYPAFKALRLNPAEAVRSE